MKKNILLFLFLFFSFSLMAQLRINELMPKNISAVRDSDTNYSMWVEVYNASDREIELAGYFFSDDPGMPRKWNPDTQVIPAGGYAVLWFEREDRSGHANFKLEPDGGVLYLYNRSGVVVDEVHYPPQYRNVSYGRTVDGDNSWSFFA
ncbi:MAG: lamin tail domain-containing protein, partial [Bacteroidales bacterium]